MATAKKRVRRRVWTPQELHTLDGEWGDVSLLTLSRKLKRTPCAVHDMAYERGLLAPGLQGYVYVKAVERLSGFDRSVVLRVLREAQVKVRLWRTQSMYHRRPARSKDGSYGPRTPRRIVCEGEAREAMERFVRCETSYGAGRRIGLSSTHLQRLAGRTPGPRKVVHRLPEEWDEIARRSHKGRKLLGAQSKAA